MRITINPSVITHTLSDHACGWNTSDYCYGDFANPALRSLCAAAKPELIRFCPLNRPSSYPAYGIFKAFALHMQQQCGTKAILHANVAPSPYPTGSAYQATDTPTGAPGHSAADRAALFQEWITAGVDVKYLQVFNEAANNVFATASNGVPYFLPEGSVGAQTRSVDWETINLRHITPALTAKIAALGRTDLTTIHVFDEACLSNTIGYQYTKSHLLGTPLMTSGTTTPHTSPSNIPHIGILGLHVYDCLGNVTSQTRLNAFFWNQANTEAAYLAEGPKATLTATTRWLRAVLDANGGSHIPMGITEGGGLTPNTHNALFDVAQAIAFCQIAGTHRLDHLLIHAMNRSDPHTEEMILLEDGVTPPSTEQGWLPGVRYYAFKDVWGKYMRLAKRQVRVTINTPAGNSPATANNNPVPRIQAVAGLSADDKTLYLMVANIDLTASEQLAYEIGGSSFTVTLPAGDARLLELPLTSTPPPVNHLELAWAEWMKERGPTGKLSQGENWRRSNPGEWTKLRLYRQNGARPELVTNTGRQMVHETDAWLAENGT